MEIEYIDVYGFCMDFVWIQREIQLHAPDDSMTATLKRFDTTLQSQN